MFTNHEESIHWVCPAPTFVHPKTVLTPAVDLALVLCDVGALEPLVAAVAGEAGLVVDAAASDHLLGDVHRLACGHRGRRVLPSACCGNGRHGWLIGRLSAAALGMCGQMFSRYIA